MVQRNLFPNLINRTEIKLRLRPSEAELLREEVSKHLPVYCYVPGRPVTFVSSVYFDTENFDLYRRAKDFPANNFKIRLKEYYYKVEGRTEVSDCCWIELKRRLGDLTTKLRFQMPKRLVNRLFRGEDLKERLRSYNPALTDEEFSKIYDEFQSLVGKLRVEPKSVTNYRRRTYQRPNDESIRITFDDMISYYRPPPLLFNGTNALVREALGKPAGVQHHAVVEIKLAARKPAWLRDLLVRYPESNFSKFLSSTQTVFFLLERGKGEAQGNLSSPAPEGGEGPQAV